MLQQGHYLRYIWNKSYVLPLYPHSARALKNKKNVLAEILRGKLLVKQHIPLQYLNMDIHK